MIFSYFGFTIFDFYNRKSKTANQIIHILKIQTAEKERRISSLLIP